MPKATPPVSVREDPIRALAYRYRNLTHTKRQLVAQKIGLDQAEAAALAAIVAGKAGTFRRNLFTELNRVLPEIEVAPDV